MDHHQQCIFDDNTKHSFHENAIDLKKDGSVKGSPWGYIAQVLYFKIMFIQMSDSA